MAKVKLIGAVKHNGNWYLPGATFEGSDAVVADLIKVGAARDPKAKSEVDTTVTDDADKAAKATVDAAQKEADGIKADAEAEAKRVTDDADKAAEKAQADADKVLADAMIQAEKIVKDAEKAAATAKAAPVGNQTK